MRTTYLVTGMTCSHCVAAVAAEIGEIPGVTAVQVDLEQGTATVDGTGYTEQQVRDAVAEAGYQVP